MFRHRRFIIGGLIILAALSYIIYGGMQQAIVYFVTPLELKANEHGSGNKFLRMAAKGRREYKRSAVDLVNALTFLSKGGLRMHRGIGFHVNLILFIILADSTLRAGEPPSDVTCAIWNRARERRSCTLSGTASVQHTLPPPLD